MDRQEARAALFRVNAIRLGEGCLPLTLDRRLTEAARNQSAFQAANGPGHVGQNGSLPGDRALASGYLWTSIAENIASGPRSAEAVVADWMANGEHRGNITNCDYKDAGIAVANGPRGPAWTLLVASGA